MNRLGDPVTEDDHFEWLNAVLSAEAALLEAKAHIDAANRLLAKQAHYHQFVTPGYAATMSTVQKAELAVGRQLGRMDRERCKVIDKLVKKFVEWESMRDMLLGVMRHPRASRAWW